MDLKRGIYSDEIKELRLKKLSQTPRVYWTPLENENKVDGLIDLAKKYITDKDFVIEVGCFSGVSSQVLALHCKELHCVDPYHWGAVVEAEKMFESMMIDYPNIKKIKMTSVDASKLYEDNSIDFVYIDADHTYNAVIEDINSWIPKVKNGGYLGGHDVYINDVKKAVEEKFGKTYETYSDTSWVVKL